MALTALVALAAAPLGGTADGTPELDKTLPMPRPPDAVCVDDDVDRATRLNNLMEGEYGSIGQWQAGDGATAVQLGADQWIFLFGDSMIGPNDGLTLPDAGYRFVNNSAIIQDRDCFWPLWGGRDATAPPRSLFDPGNGDFYWQSDGYYFDGKLVVGLHQGRLTGESIFGFEIIDRDIAVVDISTGVRGSTQFERAEIIESGPWDNTELGVLNGQFLDADPAIYNFRVPEHEDDYPGSYLARLTDLADPTEPWLFWNGSEWGADPTQVADIAPDLHAGDNRIIVPFESGGTWYAMSGSMERGAFVYIPLRADSMFGPFEVVVRMPALPLDGRSTVEMQYGHALHGTDLVGDTHVLMRWSNNEGPRPTSVTRQRPSFTSFDLATMTARPLG